MPHQQPSKYIQWWYRRWKKSSATSIKTVEKSRLLSRRFKNSRELINSRGAGRPFRAPLVRQELFEWWSGLRHAIDWKTLMQERRSRGKKHLARFPRKLVLLKVHQFLEDHAYASLLSGMPVKSFVPDYWWCRRWEQEYGLSFRKANRKYAVPRSVQKQRLEIFWLILFRVRLFILLEFGYDPVIVNFDQSPFHNNESGSQDKPTLNLASVRVPVIEGNTEVKARWTANLSTVSKQAATPQSRHQIPFHEMMFKAARDGQVYARLQEFIRSRGFPRWLSVTVAPKGSYCEQDVIEFLKKHLDEWEEGRDWRILLADDYSAHKTENVRHLAWSRGYILIIHGGGNTPVAQTCDTDLNQHVRGSYSTRETQLLLEKMRFGETVPRISHEESLMIMFEILSDPALHQRGSEGYKKTGQSVDLYGKEDGLICREAGEFWNETTTDGYPGMRARIDVDLAAVADEIRTKGIVWSYRGVQRLFIPYPKNKEVDEVLEKLGEHFYHDDIEAVGEQDDGQKTGAESCSSSESEAEVDAAEEVEAAVADKAGVAASEISDVEEVTLSVDQADKVQQVSVTIAALECHIEGLRSLGSLRAAQCVEAELNKERRKQRALLKDSPAVAAAFLQRRKAEAERDLKHRRMLEDQTERQKRASLAIKDRNAAVAELKRCRMAIQSLESTRAAAHAIKTFTVDSLGQGSPNAGGAKAKARRLEVLDRLSRLKAGLSPGQKNDWAWFKEAWDQAMVNEYKENWATTFSGWVQGILEDERTNAFSVFIYNETCRIFNNTAALHVPGC